MAGSDLNDVKFEPIRLGRTGVDMTDRRTEIIKELTKAGAETEDFFGRLSLRLCFIAARQAVSGASRSENVNQATEMVLFNDQQKGG